MSTGYDLSQIGTQVVNLAQARAKFAQELADPNVVARLANSVRAEVGSDPQAQLKYLETVMNRAASRGMSINDTISSAHRYGGYYPDATINQLSRPDAPDISGHIKVALGGSNTANFATGNESGDVHSGGAPVVAKAGGERFVVENADTPWVKSLGTIQSITSPTTAPATIASTDTGTADKIKEMNTLLALQKARQSEATPDLHSVAGINSLLNNVWRTGQQLNWWGAPRAQLVQNPPAQPGT